MNYLRAKIEIEKISTEPLAYDYQYLLASMLLHRLKSAKGELSSFLHSHTGYKYYTFSNIILEDRIKHNGGLQFSKGYFYISAIDPDFIEGFVTGLLQEPEFILGRVKFSVKTVSILRKQEIPNKCTMKTLSPIYVKTNRLDDKGNLKEWDLRPQDQKFHENLHKNLCNRYYKRYGRKPKEDHFEITKIHHLKERRNKIKNSYRKCTELKFDVQGSQELLQFAYEVGLGEKNAMGFGCMEVIK